MDGAAGEESDAALRVTFNPRLKLEFHGFKVTSDLIHRLQNDPQYEDMLILVTFDEHGRMAGCGITSDRRCETAGGQGRACCYAD